MNDKYIAKEHYQDSNVAGSYENRRFSGSLGRYRYQAEQKGVRGIVGQLPQGAIILDVPCGIGRWWPLLAEHASEIKGIDISEEMLAEAQARVESINVPVSLTTGDAEALEMDDASVDVVFSHALMKHLPIPLQYRALGEFSRVSREWVVCAFSIVNSLTYHAWKYRQLSESFILLPEQLEDMCRSAGLEIVDRKKCTTVIGVEYSVLMRKSAASS